MKPTTSTVMYIVVWFNSMFLLECSVFEAELADVIPVVKTSIAGTRIVGRMCAGEWF